MTDLPSIAESGRALRAGTMTALQLAERSLARIAAVDAKLNAFVLVVEGRARADAMRADAELANGIDKGPLHGIPYALKDIIDTAGIRTTCHSKLRLDHVPSQDSTIARKLAEGGGVLLGKLGTHEFAFGGPSFELPFPPARNPWDVDRTPGGSSSGSATAVAACMLRMAMGSDTGGSIRGPSAYCGTVGLKPTYGRVSRRGVFPLSTTLDHCGPLSRSVEDAAITLQVIAGHDPLDVASADVPVGNYLTDLKKGVEGLRIGVPRSFFANAQIKDKEVTAGIDRVIEALRIAGAIVEDITLPDYSLFAICGRVIMLTEAFAIHESDLQSRPLDFARVTFDRLVLGATVTAPDLVQAFRLRRELAAAIDRSLIKYDVLLTASSLIPAPRFDEGPSALSAASPMQTMPFNVTGHPALGVPIGLTTSGLPIGLQIVGSAFDESTVLRVGSAVEILSGWSKVKLPVF
jgi:aspartyl-tRNA(Asn)/glutamyl-tRNA(Gln) amidotransferase subunit A